MPRSSDSSNVPDQPIGQAWLRLNLDLAVPPPAHDSFVGAGARRTEVHGDRVRESYPVTYAVADEPVDHIRFALRHEPIDLTVMVAALRAMSGSDLEAWVLREPTGALARRAWFLFEVILTSGSTFRTRSAGTTSCARPEAARRGGTTRQPTTSRGGQPVG